MRQLAVLAFLTAALAASSDESIGFANERSVRLLVGHAEPYKHSQSHQQHQQHIQNLQNLQHWHEQLTQYWQQLQQAYPWSWWKPVPVKPQNPLLVPHPLPLPLPVPEPSPPCSEKLPPTPKPQPEPPAPSPEPHPSKPEQHPPTPEPHPPTPEPPPVVCYFYPYAQTYETVRCSPVLRTNP